MKQIKLGDIAKHTATGFEGVVIAHTRHLSNVDRWTIQPRVVKDGKPIDQCTFDEVSVERVSGSDLEAVPVAIVKNAAELGDTIRDRITGIEGVVISKTTWLQGCVRVGVQPKVLKPDGAPADCWYGDETDCIVLERATPKLPVKTGGPRREPHR